jgi:hypothetical protein
MWAIGYAPEYLAPAPLSASLLEAIRRHERGGDRLRADGTPLVVRAGERNRRLFQIACTLRRYGANAAALRDALTAINREHCTPPLGADELARIAASATRYVAVSTAPWPTDADCPRRS